MFVVAAYDLVKAREASASARADAMAAHLAAVAERRERDSVWARLTRPAALAPGARPVCCAA